MGNATQRGPLQKSEATTGSTAFSPPADAYEFGMAALQTMPDPFVVLNAVRDDNGRVVDLAWAYANAAATRVFRLLGLGKDDIVGCRYLEEFPDSKIFSRYVSVLEGGEPLTFERTTHDRLTRSVTFNWRLTKVGDAVAVTWRDITDVVEMERRERLEAALLDAVEPAVIATDLAYRITYWNKGAEVLYGRPEDEALGRPIFEVIFADKPAPQLPDPSQAYVAEFALNRPDGSRVSVLAQATPLMQDDRQIGVVGISVDVTELHQAQCQAADRQEEFTALTEAMTDGVMALDEDGKASYLNQAACDLLGWGREDLLGASIHAMTHFQHLDGSPYPAYECPLVGSRRFGETVRVTHDHFFRRDGTAIPVAYTASPLRGTDQSGASRGCVVVFRDISRQLDEESRAQRAIAQLAWVGRIQDALEEDRFTLYAQPIINLTTGEVERHEVLLRMHRDGSLVLPGVFLPVAEEFGLIRRIDAWVIGEAARVAAAGHVIQFNISAKSIAHPSTVELIRSTLDTWKVPGERVVCEITETALIADGTEAVVQQLAALGCRISLDDFGSGYTGLGHLKRLAVAELKIDAQFVTDAVRDASSRHVISAVVSLARGFGLRTVGEGVEDAPTVQLLRDLGVDYAQGHEVGHPVPVSAIMPDATETPKKP